MSYPPSHDDQRMRLAIGAALRRRREVRAQSQESLARVSGITPRSLHNYEHGKRDVPLGTLARLAWGLGWSVPQVWHAAQAESRSLEIREAQAVAS